MSDFNKLFSESKGHTCLYKKKRFHKTDEFPVSDQDKLLIFCEKVKGKCMQGIYLEILNKGFIEVNGKKYSGPISLWEDLFKKGNVIEITIHSEEENNALLVRNIWNIKKEKEINGAAMLIENVRNGRRYFCNDGYPDEDFDDIIFCIVKQLTIRKFREEYSKENLERMTKGSAPIM